MSLYGSNVSSGKFPGRSRHGAFAFSSDIDQTAFKDVWEGALSPVSPSDNIIFLVTAQKMLIRSESPDDSLTGSGTRTVFIEGVDENWLPVQEVIELNGQSNVETEFLYYGVNELNALSNFKQGESNVGIITAVSKDTSDLQAIITIEQGSSHGSHYTVALGHTAQIFRTNMTGLKGDEFNVRFDTIINASSGTSSRTSSIPLIFFESSIVVEFEYPVVLAGSSRIWMKAKTQTANNSLSASYGVQLLKDGS